MRQEYEMYLYLEILCGLFLWNKSILVMFYIFFRSSEHTKSEVDQFKVDLVYIFYSVDWNK